MNKSQHGSSFSETATHATLAVASHAAETGKTHYITNVTVSSDKAGAIALVKQGTTTIWQFQLLATAAGKSVESVTFPEPLVADEEALVSVEIDGTSACKANIAGFTL